MIGQREQVLLPAYICSSVVEAILAAGARPIFYDVTPALNPNLDQVWAMAGSRTAAILGVHYLGFPAQLDVLHTVALAHDALFIEDCAHILFSREEAQRPLTGKWARIFSFPKYFPMPDGAALIVPVALTESIPVPRRLNWHALAINSCDLLATTAARAVQFPIRERLREMDFVRRAVHALVTQPSGGDRAVAVDRREYEPMQLSVSVSRPSRLSMRLLASADVGFIVARRRKNYSQLAHAMLSIPGIECLFSALPSTGCPLGFPILHPDRDRLNADLIARGIDPRPIWSGLPRQADGQSFPVASAIARQNLVLPIHQDIREEDLGFLVDILRASA